MGVVPVEDLGTGKLLVCKLVNKPGKGKQNGLVTVRWDSMIHELRHVTDAGHTGLQKDVRASSGEWEPGEHAIQESASFASLLFDNPVDNCIETVHFARQS
jgi:hypothetical protein